MSCWGPLSSGCWPGWLCSPGGCTLEAIEEICGGDPVEREAVVDLVTGLVARSLVVAEDRGLGTRYRLLETIRQYGEERLAEWGETETLRIHHAGFYAALLARAAEHFYGPEQLIWAGQVNLERDNIRSALANAIEAGNAALAVQLVAETASHQTPIPIGEVLFVPASHVLDLPGAPQESGYPRVLMVAAYQAVARGDRDSAEELCREALEAERHLPAPLPGPRIEVEACALQAMTSLAAGAYADAVSAYTRAAELANADGYPGTAAIDLAHSVNSALLGGGIQEATAKAEQAVALARQSGMPAAIVLSLNALALTVVEHDPARARALLRESVERGGTPGEEVSSGVQTACLVAGRLRDWDLTLALTARTMYLFRWNLVPLQTAPCLAWCARAFADDRPEVAGVLRGAAYATFRRASPVSHGSTRQSDTAPVDPNANFVLAALRETGDLVGAALGDERRRELRTTGAAMSMDEAVSYALANIDPKLLTGSIK